MSSARELITMETIVHTPVEKVWEYWTEPSHITKWNAASDEWHAPHAENDLRVKIIYCKTATRTLVLTWTGFFLPTFK